MHPTIAKIGEAGPEAVIPLSRPDKLPQGLFTQQPANPIIVNVIVDGQVISSTIGKQAENQEQVRSS